MADEGNGVLRAWSESALVAALILVCPFVAFLRHHGYPLFSPEVAPSVAILVLAGVICGGVMMLSAILRCAIGAGLVTLYLDFQTDWFSDPVLWGELRLRWAVIWCILVLSVLMYGLGQRFRGVMLVVFGCLMIGALLVPADRLIKRELLSVDSPASGAELPFVLHVVLDEQIGIAAYRRSLPRESPRS